MVAHRQWRRITRIGGGSAGGGVNSGGVIAPYENIEK